MMDPAASPPDRRPLSPWVITIGGIVFTTLMALSPRYGFQRDELYMLECARHLQAGYVDQPALAPLLARVSLELFGMSLPGLRLWPALAAGATVLAGGLTARELGGGRRAQVLAAIATATMPVLLGAAHVANTTPYVLLAVAGLALVVTRIGGTGDTRWWLAAGAVAGLGVAANHQVGLFAVALVVGALLSGGWRLVLNGWFAVGAGITVAFASPDIWWQARHQWAASTMTRALNHENGGLGNIPVWVVGQLVLVSLALVWVWPAGVRFLWRSGRPLWRALVWSYLLLFALYALTSGAQIYYLAGAYVCLLAAGCVAVDSWLARRPHRPRIVAVAAVVAAAPMLMLVLPVLPPSTIGRGHVLDQTLAETVGWPDLVDTVAKVWTSLPPRQQADSVIFTAVYSEAGAINELGRDRGLPTAVSGHNSEWWWGPGNPHATTIVAVAPGGVTAAGYDVYLGHFFTDVRRAATLRNHDDVHNIEQGGGVYICNGPRQTWSQMWPQLRHYD